MDAHDEAATQWIAHWTDGGSLLAGAESELATCLRKAAADEREACAETATSVYEEHMRGNPLAATLGSPGDVLEVAAALIRARGEK